MRRQLRFFPSRLAALDESLPNSVLINGEYRREASAASEASEARARGAREAGASIYDTRLRSCSAMGTLGSEIPRSGCENALASCSESDWDVRHFTKP